jgi:hypothetical protein
MNIEQAINILAQCSPDNHKNFKKQINHYQVELTSPLKDYLDFIDIDVLEWLNTSPENYKAESTFYAFKSPINTLLKHKDVIAEYGEQYCTSLAKNISLVFSQNIDSIIKARNNTIIIEDKSDYTESDNDNDSDHDDTVLNVDELEYENPKDKIKTCDYQDKTIKTLEKKLQDAETNVKVLETSLHYLKLENDKLWELVNRLATRT